MSQSVITALWAVVLTLFLFSCAKPTLPTNWPLTDFTLPTGSELVRVRKDSPVRYPGQQVVGDWTLNCNCVSTTSQDFKTAIYDYFAERHYLSVYEGASPLSETYVSSDGLVEVHLSKWIDFGANDSGLNKCDFSLKVTELSSPSLFLKVGVPLSKE